MCCSAGTFVPAKTISKKPLMINGRSWCLPLQLGSHIDHHGVLTLRTAWYSTETLVEVIHQGPVFCWYHWKLLKVLSSGPLLLVVEIITDLVWMTRYSSIRDDSWVCWQCRCHRYGSLILADHTSLRTNDHCWTLSRFGWGTQPSNCVTVTFLILVCFFRAGRVKFVRTAYILSDAIWATALSWFIILCNSDWNASL